MELSAKRVSAWLIAVIAAVVLSIGLYGCSSNGGNNESSDQQAASVSASSAEPTPLEIVDSGYSIEEYMSGSFVENWGVVVENKNTNWAAQDIKLIITGRDADGKVVGTDYEYLTALFAGGKQAIGGSSYFDDAETLEFRIEESKNMWLEEELKQSDVDTVWYAKDLNEKTKYDETTVSGEVVNESQSSLPYCSVNVLFLNDAGEIVGGGNASVDTVPAGSSIPFSLSVGFLPKYSSVQAYVDPGMPEE